VGANAGFDGSGIDPAGAALLHLGYPSLLPALLDGGGAGLVALLRRARAAGLTTSLDLAVLDPASPAAREDWPALLRRVLPHVDVLTPSVDDVRSLLDPAARAEPGDMRRVARLLVGLGAAVVMLTGGAAGAQLCTGGAARLAEAGALLAGDAGRRWSDHESFAPVRPVAVRTTVGSGDAATAGLLYGLLAGRDPAASLELAMRTATRWTAGLPVLPDGG
jgi:sugar/nucleoside kinase (ribokinase family)